MIKPVPCFAVECDAPGCDVETSTLNDEYAGWGDESVALDEWIACDGVVLDDGRTFCEAHAPAEDDDEAATLPAIQHVAGQLALMDAS